MNEIIINNMYRVFIFLILFQTLTRQHGIGGSKTPAGVSRNKSDRERKIGHRRVGVGGEITYKKVINKIIYYIGEL